MSATYRRPKPWSRFVSLLVGPDTWPTALVRTRDSCLPMRGFAGGFFAGPNSTMMAATDAASRQPKISIGLNYQPRTIGEHVPA